MREKKRNKPGRREQMREKEEKTGVAVEGKH